MRRNITYRALLKDSINDWFLGSKDALAAMHTNLYAQGIGNFQLADYWSSSENDATKAWKHDFFTNTQSAYTKAGSGLIRPCRTFTAGIGDYVVGDAGPSDGWIFYVNGTTYHEALAYDLPSSYTWSNITGIEIGITAQGTAVGEGQTNTTAIMAQSGNVTDWFLPSTDELQEMYDELKAHAVGGFLNTYYWTSVDANSSYGKAINFSTGTTNSIAKNVSARSIRAARTFESTDVYAVRDTGLSGGLIFHIIDLGGGDYRYYEAALLDLSVNIWSNISTPVPVTNTSIGEGENNTILIIGQAGHTNSAAKDCDDYDYAYAHTSSAAKECNDLIT